MQHLRRALVTGANRGIGREVVRQLGELGYRVLLGSRNAEVGAEVARDIGFGVEAVQLNIAQPDSIDAVAADLATRFGGLDVLVNNAGAYFDSYERATTADWRIIREAFETNLFGAWRLIQAFAPGMRERGWGRIVNVSSESGSLTTMVGDTPAYSASKAALNALTRCLAIELRDTGVLVNAVTPGWTATDMGGGGRSVPEGAASVVWAVTIPDDGPSGAFFRDGLQHPW